MQDIFAQYLSNDDLADFAIWAFGPGVFRLYSSKEFLKAWNKRHSKALKLESTSNPSKDAPKMIALWKKNRDQSILDAAKPLQKGDKIPKYTMPEEVVEMTPEEFNALFDELPKNKNG